MTKRQRKMLVRKYNSLRPSWLLEEWRSDVALLSFPKCGRTWLRYMLGRALAQHHGLDTDNVLQLGDLAKRSPRIPRIIIDHDDDCGYKRPEQLRESKQKYHNKRVILLVRDPRDTIVSYYFHQTRRARLFEGSIEDFVNDPRGSLETLLRYYKIWDANRTVPRGFLLVRYEDLKVDAARELRRILDFLGIEDVRDEVVQDAVAFASFENMRKREQAQADASRDLQPRVQNDTASYKTREGVVGGYRKHLDGALLEHVNRRIDAELPGWFGYQTDQRDGSRVRRSE